MESLRPLWTTVIFGAALAMPLPSLALVDTALGVAIGGAMAGKSVSNIVNEVRLTGSSLLDQATQTGNGMISRAGNEAAVLAGNLDVMFKDNMNLTFNRLSEERKAVLIEAEAMRRTLASVTDKAYNFKDSAALDLNAIVTSFPFVKERFFVQSIRGLSYLPQAADFRLQVAASTLGTQEGLNTQIEVFKGVGPNKTLLPNVLVDQSKQRFFADLAIPNANLASDFKDNDLVLVPLTLRFNTSRAKGWWLFKSEEKQTYDVPVYLNFFPRQAGQLVSVTKQPTYDWFPAGTKTERLDTPNRHCDKDCRGERTRGGNRIEFAVPGGPKPYKAGNKFLRNPSQRCIGGNCAFSDSFNLALSENDTRLIFTWSTWSTPGTWEASAEVMEYRLAGEATETSPAPVVFNFGRIIEIMVPVESTFGVLKVKTFTKQDYEVPIGEPDPYGILTYQGKTPAGPGLSRVTYRVNDPAVVAATTRF
jgi:hypothetical protein